MPRRLMVVAAYDSQLKWATRMAAGFVEKGWVYSVVVPADLRHSLSPEQVAASGGSEFRLVPWAELLRESRHYDCVLLAVQGPLVERFTDELVLLDDLEPSERQPVSVSGWVGIIIEKLVAGYLDRAGTDVVAVNSADNLRAFESAGARLGLPSDNLLLSGLPILPARLAAPGTGPIKTVVFADQPTVPVDLWDRAYVYQRLIDYAEAHPARRVLLKPRHRPDEATFHVMKHHPERVLAGLPPAPGNFSVTYEPITDLLPSTDLMITVSSTAALEAIGAGVRTAFVGDLGVHEKFGNHVLLDSNLIARFEDLIADRIPTPDPQWLDDLFLHHDDLSPVERVVNRVEELLDIPPKERPGAIVRKGSYLSGRLAVRRRRMRMPAMAKGPQVARPVAPPAGWRGGVWRRTRLFAQAALPGRAYAALHIRAVKRRWQ